MSKDAKIFLILILILGFFLRFYKLGEVPIGFVSDEAAIGYNAYSILKTGKDEFGRFFPLHFQSLGEYKLPVYIYALVPFVKFFDLKKETVRLPSAVFGFLTLIICYLFFKKVFKSQTIGLLSAFLMGISPWHIVFSRAAFEANLCLFFIFSAFLFLIYFLEKEEFRYLFTFYLLSLIAMFTYNSARLFIPVFGILSFLLIFSKKKKKIFLSSFILYLLFIVIPVLFIFLSKESLIRVKQISIFENRGVQLKVDEKIREDGVFNLKPLILTRVLHNKLKAYSFDFLKRYLEHFDLNYLFLTGDNISRYRVKDFGLFYFWLAPFFIYGLFIVFRSLINHDYQIKKDFLFLILAWLFLTPLASSLTIETPNALRTLIGLPAYLFIIIYGIKDFYEKIPEKKLLKIGGKVIFLIFSLYSLLTFLDLYFIHEVLYQPYFSQYEYRDLVSKINQIQNKYSKIYVTESHADPYIFFLFYNKYDPSLYHKKIKIRSFSREGFIRYYGFDNLVFSDEICPLKKEKNVLFVCDGKYGIPIGGKLIETIFYSDKNPAFYLLEYQEVKKKN